MAPSLKPLMEPFPRPVHVFFNDLAFLIHYGKRELRLVVILLGGFLKPLEGFGKVLFAPIASGIHSAEKDLRLRLSFFAGPAKASGGIRRSLLMPRPL